MSKIDSDIEFLVDGHCNEDTNFFISPHILICKNINHYVFSQEFFGPILVIYPYNYNKYSELWNYVLKLIIMH
jgi:1-pyrroline-5-carboxylate dehydrogenase